MKTPLGKPGGVFLFREKATLRPLSSLVLLLRGFGRHAGGLVFFLAA
jgi:hypothetical protein